jgi:hypothetical protein
MKITIPKHLSNDELLAGLQHFAASERRGTAQLVAHLVELETRGLHIKAAFTSLFAYCCEALRLSEDAAYNRIEAARAARRFPVILDMLDSGELSVTTARMLGRILTPENHATVLAAASGQSKRAVEELVVQYAPRPDVSTSLRKVPERTGIATIPTATTIVPEESTPALPALSSRPAEPASAPSRPASVTPLAPSRYELKVTVSQETRDKLRLAQDLLRHAIPSGDTAVILDRALTLLLADVARKKFAATKRPRPSRAATTDSREPAAHVKRAVCERDGNRCAYVAPDGRRCNARAFLEFHHLKMYVNGGQATVENLALRCRRHNQYEADVFFEGIVRERTATYGVSVGGSSRSGTAAPTTSRESLTSPRRSEPPTPS